MSRAPRIPQPRPFRAADRPSTAALAAAVFATAAVLASHAAAQTTVYNGAYVANTTLTGQISINSGDQANAVNSPTKLDTVTLAGTATVNRGQALELMTDLTFDGGTLVLGDSSRLETGGGPISLLGTGNVVVNSCYPPLMGSLGSGGSVGPGITFSVGAVTSTSGEASFYFSAINMAGTVLSEIPNGTIFFSGYPSGVHNTGTWRAGNGGQIASDTLINDGSIVVEPGGKFTVTEAPFTNNSTVSVAAGASLVLPATFSNTGQISASSPLTFSGTWSNTGSVSVNATSLSLGGTWSNTGTVTATNASLTLAGTPSSLGSYSLPGTSLSFAGSFTTAQVRHVAAGAPSSISLATGTIDNTGDSITLSAGAIPLYLAGATISSGAVTSADGTPLLANTGGSRLLNVSLSAPVAVAGAAMLQLSGGTVASNVTVSGGGTLVLSGSLSNQGSIALAPGSTLRLAGPFTSTGTVAIDSGTISIGSPFTLPQLAPISATNSIFSVDAGGTLDLSGGTVAPAGGNAWKLNAGKITAGNIAAPLACSGGILDNITASADLSILPGPTVTATGTFTLAGSTVNVGSHAMLLLGTSTLAGNGQVHFDPAGIGHVRPNAQAASMTIAPGITIHSGGGTGDVGLTSYPLINQGTLSADTAGQTLLVYGSTVTNAGVMRAANGGTLLLGGTFTSLGTVDASGGTLAIIGTFNNAGQTFTLSPTTTGNLQLAGGAISGGTVVAPQGTQFLVAGATTYGPPATSSLTSGVTFDGNMVFVPGTTLNVTGGLTLANHALVTLSGTSSTGASTIFFSGTQSLGGDGEISFDGANAWVGPAQANSLRWGGTLTIDPGIAIHTGTHSGTLGTSWQPQPLVSAGVISSRTPGNTLSIWATTLTNTGTLEATNGGAMLITTTATTNSGTISAAGASSLVKLKGTLTNNGKIDLAGGSLILDYSGTSPVASVRSQLLGGRAGGAWNASTGITSSTAAADPSGTAAIGYIESAALLGLTGTATATWAGQSVDATTLLLQPTLYGDANLDGKITADDYALLDRGYAQYLAGTIPAAGAVWSEGDFNYDGLLDSSDFLLLDRSFALSSGSLPEALLSQRLAQFGPAYLAALSASLPEPSPLFLLFPLLLSLRPRRTHPPRA